jgi:hypothetical protein
MDDLFAAVGVSTAMRQWLGATLTLFLEMLELNKKIGEFPGSLNVRVLS